MAAPEPNGSVFQRRFSRAYDQPIVHNSGKGTVVIRADGEGSGIATSYEAGQHEMGLEALGSLLAKATLCLLTLVGLSVGILGRASLEVASQFIGFMLLFVVIFFACSGTFYWWGTTSKSHVKLTITRILSVYGVCIASDVVARLVNAFSRVPPSSSIPIDISYFVSLATVLLFSFTLLFHDSGLNAMFSRESVLFVVCSLVFNYSSSRLFSEFMPMIILPQMVHAGTLLGLSLSLAGYKFPQISPSGLYWMLNQKAGSKAQQQVEPSLPEISVDHSPQVTNRKISSSSTQSKARVSISSLSSMTSFPQGVDMESVTEARGLISDLLLNEETIPKDTQQRLRRVRDILAQRSDKSLNSSKIPFGSSYSLEDEHDYESDISSRASSVSRKDPNTLAVKPAWSNKPRSLSVVQMRRSTSKFSTTTTASGMPVIENEPLDRTRSVALRDVKARISVREKRYSVHKMGRERLGSFEGRPGSGSSHKDRLSTISTTSYRSNVSDSEVSEGDSGSQKASSSMSGQVATPEDTSSSVIGHDIPTLVRSNSEGDDVIENIEEGEKEVADSPRPRSLTDPTGHRRKLGVVAESEEPPNALMTITERTFADRGMAKRIEDSKGAEPVADDEDDKVFGEGVFKAHKFYSFTKYKRPSVTCDLAEYTSNDHLDMFENVAIWDYPIFELEEKAGNHILSHMAHMLFHEAGLMETFQIPQREFINYFRALEANYGRNVYHNKTHAADVLHAVSYLLFEIIPEFSHEFQTDDSARERKIDSRTSGAGSNIASAFSILEVLACYMASAMHDFDHPGRTNAFLVGTRSHLALLYNDRSVLENHHAAASWHLLTNFAENNFLVSMEAAEMKRLRFLIIEAILATDLKMHFDLLATFRAKTNPEEGGGINWDMEMDRLLVMQMVIKMADINTPTKNFDLHRNWSKRITEEFYQQSEEEAALGIPETIHMDRRHPEKLPAIQLSFIQNLVSPLFQACAEAGIIPGILEAGSDKDGASRTASPTDKGAEEVNEDAIESEATEVAEPKFMSIILTNLQINFEGWKAELPEEDAAAKSEKAGGVKTNLQDEGAESQGVEAGSQDKKSEDGEDAPLQMSQTLPEEDKA